MNILRLPALPAVLLTVALTLAACGTPQAVKDLSLAQIDAIDAAIENSREQGQAIVKLATQLKERTIADRTRERGLAREQAIAQLAGVDDREAALNAAFEAGAARAQSAAELEETLNGKIAEIERLTGRLTSLLAELKNAQAAIHKFLETETVGEQLGESILGNPLVSGALGTASRFLRETRGVSGELGDLVDSVVAESATE